MRAWWLPECGWFAALGLLVVLVAWWFPGEPTAPSDTYGTGLTGKRLFYDLVERLGSVTERSHVDPGILADELGYSNVVLCLIGPPRDPGRRVWDDLYRWVFHGGSLLVAASLAEPALDLRQFGIRVAPLDDDWPEEAPEESPPEAAVATDLVPAGDISWETRGELENTLGWRVRLAWRGKPQAASRKIGLGHVLVVSSDYLFSNRSLVRGDNAVLAYGLLESLGPVQSVVFDQSLHARGGAKVIGWLFDPSIRPFTLQFLICVLLFAWWGSRRFGAPNEPAEPPRRSVVEHAEALGNLHYRTGSGAWCVRSLLEFVRHELRVGAGGESALRDATRQTRRIASRSGLSESEVAEILAEAEGVVAERRLPASRAADRIRDLARLNRLARRRRSSG